MHFLRAMLTDSFLVFEIEKNTRRTRKNRGAYLMTYTHPIFQKMYKMGIIPAVLWQRLCAMAKFPLPKSLIALPLPKKPSRK